MGAVIPLAAPVSHQMYPTQVYHRAREIVKRQPKNKKEYILGRRWGGNTAGRTDVSSYEKSVESLLREAVAQENTGDIGFYYIKKGASVQMIAGVQFPKQILKALTSSNGIIHRFSEKVNMRIAEETQSLQFRRWFGDWQNDPKNASKEENADGRDNERIGADKQGASPVSQKKKQHKNRLREWPFPALLQRPQVLSLLIR